MDRKGEGKGKEVVVKFGVETREDSKKNLHNRTQLHVRNS